jgi:hypothetical protein
MRIIISGETMITENGGATTRDETVITAAGTGIAADMTDATFATTTGAIIIGRRFGKISRTFAERERKSMKAAGSCAEIIRS